MKRPCGFMVFGVRGGLVWFGLFVSFWFVCFYFMVHLLTSTETEPSFCKKMPGTFVLSDPLLITLVLIYRAEHLSGGKWPRKDVAGAIHRVYADSRSPWMLVLGRFSGNQALWAMCWAFWSSNASVPLPFVCLPWQASLLGWLSSSLCQGNGCCTLALMWPVSL